MYQELFQLDKLGRVRQFIVSTVTRENSLYLVTRKGILGGAMQEDWDEVVIKNIGKANETTPEQQAEIMFNSKVNKLLDKGYKVLPDDGFHFTDADITYHLKSIEGTDALGNIKPMLAHKNLERVIFPGYVQRKYDGMRCVAGVEGTLATLRTRNGKPVQYMGHIVNDIDWNALLSGWKLDGELYVHESFLGDIVSMVKRDQPANKNIRYRVYDLIATGMTFEERYQILLVMSKNWGPSLELASTYKVNDWGKVTDFFERFRKQGFEGAMWRSPSGLYLPGKRSYDLIKIKDFMEDEFEITDVLEATGRDAGTAVFECTTKSGITFTCRPMGTREQRKEYYDHPERCIGKMLTVRFQNYTKEGKPFHLRGVIIRDYE